MVTKVLRFTAGWCGPCKMLKMMLLDVDTTVPTEVVDIDVNPEIAQEYGVRGVPTMIALDGNTEMYRIVGVPTKDKLNQFFEGTYAKG